MTNYKELRALCDAATDGEWCVSGQTTGYYPIKTIANNKVALVCRVDRKRYLHQENPSIESELHANARFIAATDPQTVRALIDEVEKYRAALEKVLPMLEEVQDTDIGYLIMDEDCRYASEIVEQALKGTGHE